MAVYYLNYNPLGGGVVDLPAKSAEAFCKNIRRLPKLVLTKPSIRSKANLDGERK